MQAILVTTRLEMTFSHSTLGAAPLNDEEAHEREKKWQLMKFACSLEVKRLKGSVSAQRST